MRCFEYVHYPVRCANPKHKFLASRENLVHSYFRAQDWQTFLLVAFGSFFSPLVQLHRDKLLILTLLCYCNSSSSSSSSCCNTVAAPPLFDTWVLIIPKQATLLNPLIDKPLTAFHQIQALRVLDPIFTLAPPPPSQFFMNNYGLNKDFSRSHSCVFYVQPFW